MISGGHANYGQDIGILMLDTVFPRLVGDIGNARTFSFPVRYKVVPGALPAKVVLADDGSLLTEFIAAARELEAAGVKAITTSCGFLALYQQELAAAVAVPVFTSSLLQVPMVQRMLAPGRKTVIVTANSARLSPRHLKGAGVDGDPGPIIGMEDKAEFVSVFFNQKQTLDYDKLCREAGEVAGQIRDRYPDAGAVVLECTNLPPFRHIFAAVTGCPVFDIVTLINALQHSLLPVSPAAHGPPTWGAPAHEQKEKP